MLISPFTPLTFEPYKGDGIESRYSQVFAPTDRILLQVLCAQGESAPVSWLRSSARSTLVQFRVWNNSSSTKVYFAEITGLTAGEVYYIDFPNLGIKSNYFRATDNEDELKLTTLIQYSMKDNRQRTDAVFLIDSLRYFFDFRVPGGFKDSGWTFSVDSEQFITPQADPVQLFALESTQKRFTMGGQEGVPVWFGEMLNRLLCCSYVYFDGVRYARKESNVPEMNVLVEGLDSFVFTQTLQKVGNLNPTIESTNFLSMRRVYEPYAPYLSDPETDENMTSNTRII